MSLLWLCERVCVWWCIHGYDRGFEWVKCWAGSHGDKSWQHTPTKPSTVSHQGNTHTQNFSLMCFPSTLFDFFLNAHSVLFPTFPNTPPACDTCFCVSFKYRFKLVVLCKHRSTSLKLRHVLTLRVLEVCLDLLVWSNHLVQFYHLSRWGPGVEIWGS